jgi:hypothetical protein
MRLHSASAAARLGVGLEIMNRISPLLVAICGWAFAIVLVILGLRWDGTSLSALANVAAAALTSLSVLLLLAALVMAGFNLWRGRRTVESVLAAVLVLPAFLVAFIITRPIE